VLQETSFSGIRDSIRRRGGRRERERERERENNYTYSDISINQTAATISESARFIHPRVPDGTRYANDLQNPFVKLTTPLFPSS